MKVCKRFARFEARRGRSRTEEQPSVVREAIGESKAQRKLGADDGQVDSFGSGEFGDCRQVREIDREGARHARNSWVTGRRNKRLGFRVRSEPRDQRVFARTAAQNQNSHRLSSLGCVKALHVETARAGLFR